MQDEFSADVRTGHVAGIGLEQEEFEALIAGTVRDELVEASANLLRVLDNVVTHAPQDGYTFGSFGENKAMKRLRRALKAAR